MAIKGLSELLEKFKKGEIEDVTAFEVELNKSLGEEWLPKAKYNEAVEARKQAEKQASDNAKLLDDLKGKAELSDAQKEEIEKLKNAQAEEKKAYEAQLMETQRGYAIETALRDSKAKNLKAATALLDMSKVVRSDDGTFSGITEQLDQIKKDNAFLFDAEPDTPPGGGPVPSFGGGGGSTPSSSGGLYGRMLKAAGIEEKNDKE